MAAIQSFFSEDEKADFASCVDDTLQRYAQGDTEILDQLPVFDFAPRADGVAITVIFPDAEEA